MADDDFEDDFEETFDEFEEGDEPELEGDEPDLEEDLEGDIDEGIEGEELTTVDEEDEEEAEPVVKKRRVADEEDDEEELIDPDDVEADLDTIFRDRIAAGADDDEEDEDTPEADTPTEPGDRVQPRRADEFLCESCFLVKHASQRVGSSNICRELQLTPRERAGSEHDAERAHRRHDGHHEPGRADPTPQRR